MPHDESDDQDDDFEGLDDLAISVITIKPKEPYLQWARNVFEDDNDGQAWEEAERDLLEDCNAYLIPPLDDKDELKKILQERCKVIFEQELN